jgi:hypothetical protein
VEEPKRKHNGHGRNSAWTKNNKKKNGMVRRGVRKKNGGEELSQKQMVKDGKPKRLRELQRKKKRGDQILQTQKRKLDWGANAGGGSQQ